MIRWRFTDRNNQYEDVFLNYNAETDTYEEYKPYAIVHCETKEDFDRMQQALKEQKLGGVEQPMDKRRGQASTTQ